MDNAQEGTLNQYLQPSNAPIANKIHAANSFYFNRVAGRDAITATKIKNFSFNQGHGGTLVLGGNFGGTNNSNGILQIEDINGSIIVQGDNLGNHYYNTGGTELVRIDSSGFHAYNSSGTELVKVDNIGFHTYDGTHNQLIQIDNAGLHFTDSGGGTKIELVSGGLFAYGNNGAQVQFRTAPSDTTSKGVIGIDGSGNFLVASNNGNPLYLSGQTNVTISATGNGADMTIQTNNADMKLLTGSGAFKLNGVTKTAIVETSQGHKALYCAESPEVWFFDFCEDKDEIDPLFLEVTEGKMRFVKLEDGGYQVWRKRRGFVNTRFEPKTAEQFTKNEEFWSTPQK